MKASDKAEIPKSEKKRLAIALTDWYYKDGGGLFLSHAAAGQCFAARRLRDRAESLDCPLRVPH